MTLDSFMYRDPMLVAIRMEEIAQRKAKACGNCIHQSGVVFKGEAVHVCEFKRQVYGRRCHLFETEKVRL